MEYPRIFFYLLIAWLGGPDRQTTPEILAQLNKMGSERWVVRQKTMNELARISPAPIRVFEKYRETHEHLEVRRRCELLYRKSVQAKNAAFVGIYDMPNSLRFPLGFFFYRNPYGREIPITPVDLARLYYAKVKAEEDWRDQGVAVTATRLLIADLKKGGMTDQECTALLKIMSECSTTQRYSGYFIPAEKNNWPGIARKIK